MSGERKKDDVEVGQAPRVFRWSFLPFIVALIFMLPIALLANFITPYFNYYLSPLSFWELMGVAMFAVGGAAVGIDAGLMGYSPQFMCQNGIFPLADVNLIEVEAVPYDLDPALAATLPDSARLRGVDGSRPPEPDPPGEAMNELFAQLPPKARQGADAVLRRRQQMEDTALANAPIPPVPLRGQFPATRLPPGTLTGESGPMRTEPRVPPNRTVSIRILPLGGRKAWGLHIGAGSSGFLLLQGEGEVARMGAENRGEMLFTGKIMVPIHHNQVSENVMKRLRRLQNFTPTSVIYVLTTYSPPYIDYIRDNAEAHEAMIEGVPPAGVHGSADAVYHHNRELELTARVNGLLSTIDDYEEGYRSQAQTLRGKARREADVFRQPTEPPAEAPAYARAGRVPNRPGEQ